MTAGAKHLPPFPFGNLTGDEFEELVYLLAQVDDAKVARLRAPDGGLDTVRPSDSDPLVADWGIQAKLHCPHIKWPSCKESLDRAVSIWGVSRITYAFPRDLTLPQHKLFHKHLVGRCQGVSVDWWGAGKLTGLLLASPAGRGIAKRFFHAEDPADLADRAIRAGGPLRTAADLLDREMVTGEFLRSADPHFDWVSTKRTRTSEPVPPSTDGVLRLQFGSSDQEWVVDAVPRSPSAMQFAPRGELVFADVAATDGARVLLRAVEAEGGRADLGDAVVRLDRIPAPFDELVPPAFHGQVSIRARRHVPPWAATISIDSDEGTANLDVDLIPREPEDEWDARLTGQRHGLTIELRFVWSHSQHRGTLRVTWHFTRVTGSAQQRADVLAFVIALHGRGMFTIGDREERRPALTQATPARPVPEQLRLTRRFYDDFATLRSFVGVAAGPPPDQATGEDAHRLAWLAQSLRDGGYTGTLTAMKMRCDSGALPGLNRIGNEIEVVETLCARLFGREFAVGRRSATLPLMTVNQLVRVPGPAAMWDVEFVPLAGDSAPVRFTLEPLATVRRRNVA